MARYSVRDLFGPGIHGVGAHAGRACVFLRFGDGDELTAAEIITRLLVLDTSRTNKVVVSGEDCARRWDAELAAAVRGAGFRVLLETDGATVPGAPVDWLAITPGATVADGLHADEVRVVVDDAVDEAMLDRHAARWRCDHYYVVPRSADHVARAVTLIMSRTRWRLSLPIAISATSLGAPQKDVKPGSEPESAHAARLDQPLRAV